MEITITIFLQKYLATRNLKCIANIGKNNNLYDYLFISLVITLIGLFIVIFISIWPYILNIIKPKNESRPDFLMQIMRQFIDQEKYSYLVLFHMNAALCIGAIAVIATGTMLIGYLQYACGMFKIAR